MKKLPLWIRKIHVREAPGIGSGLDPLAELSPGINIIYGPNGSGKSTTLRVLQASLSPGSLDLRFRGDRVETVVALEETASTVVLRDLERVPLNSSIPEVGNELVRDCRFSLSELMDAASGGEYGRLFIEAAAGGLDLVQVARALGFNNRNNPRRTDRNQLSQLRHNLVAAENDVGKLSDAKRDLSRSEEEHDQLKSDARRLDLVREAIRHRGQLGELEQARLQLNGFPPCMKNLVGDELDRLKKAEEQILEAKGELKRLRDTWHLEIRKRRESGLGNPVEPGLLQYLDQKKEELDAAERDLATNEIEQAKSAGAMRTAHELVGDQVPEDVLKAADAGLLNQLEQWCDRVEEHQGKVAATAELEQDLGDLSPIPASGAARDIQLLRDWLAADRAQEAGKKLGSLLLVAALVVLVVSLVLGIFIHPAGFSGLLGAAGLGFAWLQFRRGQAEECRREAEEKCQQSPAAWTRQAVNRLIEQLEQKHAHEMERQQRITRWESVLNNRKSEIDEESRKLSEDAEALSRILGFVPRLGRKCFGMVAKALIDWQVAFRSSTSATEAADQVRTNMGRIRSSIQPKLRDFKMGIALDCNAAELAGWISDLRDRDQQFKDACRGMELARGGVSRCLAEIRKARGEIANVFARIAPNPADDVQLRELLGRLDDYQKARDEVKAYGQAEREAEKFFKDYPDLAPRPLDELKEEIETIGNPAKRLTEVSQEIGAIKERLRSARSSTDVEEKMIEFENRQATLQIEREEMLARVAGMALAEQVQEKVASETVPAVQRRAGELLRDFTCGTCELVVETAGVKALQPAEGQRLFELDELSDGTRAQLFIAVRLAFVEQGEKGLRLPLFFDEAFANTDSDRGRKIMEALLEISRQGRQVFCFTSQAGEYSRWSELLAGKAENEARLLTLRKGFAQPTVQAALRPPPRYPKPSENESFGEYAQRIGVWQKIDPWIDSVDEVSIVHVLENPQDLRLLLESALHAWGPLARLGPQECGLEAGEAAFEKAGRRAEFLHGVCSLWQHGRGRPITRDLLDEAGVTNTPANERLEETWKHAENFGRDAGRLCKALEQGEISVSGLGAKRIADLREFCVDRGLIVPEQPFDEGELRLRAGNLGRSLGLAEEESARLLEFFTISK